MSAVVDLDGLARKLGVRSDDGLEDALNSFAGQLIAAEADLRRLMSADASDVPGVRDALGQAAMWVEEAQQDIVRALLSVEAHERGVS